MINRRNALIGAGALLICAPAVALPITHRDRILWLTCNSQERTILTRPTNNIAGYWYLPRAEYSDDYILASGKYWFPQPIPYNTLVDPMWDGSNWIKNPRYPSFQDAAGNYRHYVPEIDAWIIKE